MCNEGSRRTEIIDLEYSPMTCAKGVVSKQLNAQKQARDGEKFRFYRKRFKTAFVLRCTILLRDMLRNECNARQKFRFPPEEKNLLLRPRKGRIHWARSGSAVLSAPSIQLWSLPAAGRPVAALPTSR